MMHRSAPAAIIVGLLFCGIAQAGVGERSLVPPLGDEGIDGLDLVVAPLKVEAGPILSPPLGTEPVSHVYGSVGFRYGTTERGLAEYTGMSTMLLLGGEWRPAKARWLGVGDRR